MKQPFEEGNIDGFEVTFTKDFICCGTCKWQSDGECYNENDCIDFDLWEELENIEI